MQESACGLCVCHLHVTGVITVQRGRYQCRLRMSYGAHFPRRFNCFRHCTHRLLSSDFVLGIVLLMLKIQCYNRTDCFELLTVNKLGNIKDRLGL